MTILTAGRQLFSSVLALCLLVACANLTGCGQIGPLYLPDDNPGDNPPAATTAAGESDSEERDNDDKPDGL
jgi:predicted small lipoprotein YifL